VDKAFGQLHFVDETAKVNADYYVNKLLPNLVKDCRRILPDQFISQQDRAPANTASLTQDWLSRNCPEFIRKDEWPPNSSDLNPLPLTIMCGVRYLRCISHSLKPTSSTELKTVLKALWSDLPKDQLMMQYCHLV